MTICVIPARGGSVRIPRKNLKVFHGKPIIQYSIEASLGAGFDTIVSTDDQEIASFAESCGADVHYRHWEDPDGAVGTQELVARVLERLDVEDNEYVCCLYATAPAVTSQVLVGVQSDFETSMAVWVVGSYPYRMEDCGAVYFGHADSFKSRLPLIEWTTEATPIHNHIDINVPEDWALYEEMYRDQAI